MFLLSGMFFSHQIQKVESRLDRLESVLLKMRHSGSSPTIIPSSASPQQHDTATAFPGFTVPEYLFLTSPLPKTSPVVRHEDGQKRKIYGGKGDPSHLGGFTNRDLDGQSPTLWTWMLNDLNIRSVVDVGCGKGFSSRWFADHGVDTVCVEGSSDALAQHWLPSASVVHHDFTLGPWWPKNTVDAVWCVEFVEHVSRNFSANYLALFKRAALVFMTFSVWGGWHHVEVHFPWWWRVRMEAAGLVYSQQLTELAQTMARAGMDEEKELRSQHLVHNLLVFINPDVASLPQHQHVIGGYGCVDEEETKVECRGADEMPARFRSNITEIADFSPATDPFNRKYSNANFSRSGAPVTLRAGEHDVNDFPKASELEAGAQLNPQAAPGLDLEPLQRPNEQKVLYQTQWPSLLELRHQVEQEWHRKAYMNHADFLVSSGFLKRKTEHNANIQSTSPGS
mmetsp:Transcript_50226/g.98463  ORF Transcript_50226/g.98463 Transcript_50226/m.98463 type:complete len:452 (+) Transcript_50226:124-1479(+)